MWDTSYVCDIADEEKGDGEMIFVSQFWKTPD